MKKRIIGKKFRTIAAACCTAAALIIAVPATTLAASNCIHNMVYVSGKWLTVGDCNEDGYINMADYVTLTQYVNDLNAHPWIKIVQAFDFFYYGYGASLPWHYDIDGDGAITSSDSQELLRYIMS